MLNILNDTNANSLKNENEIFLQKDIEVLFQMDIECNFNKYEGNAHLIKFSNRIRKIFLEKKYFLLIWDMSL